MAESVKIVAAPATKGTAVEPPPEPTHRAYVACHQITGEHAGKRKDWSVGDTLHLTPDEAAALGSAVRPQ